MTQPLITFPPGAKKALFIQRKQRFLVEVETEEGPVWIHTNNSGSMLGLLQPGAEVWMSPATTPGRRLPYTLELIKIQGFWVGVNTMTPNRLLYRAWESGRLPETEGYDVFRKEAKIENSRLDGFLSGPNGAIWVEAKNVTMVEDEIAAFPDAVTQRGQKHLSLLMSLRSPKARVANFYLIQRPDGKCFGPADYIDPEYARLFWRSREAGVEIWPYRAVVSPAGIDLGPRLPLAPQRMTTQE